MQDILELQEQLIGFYKRESAAREVIKQTQDRAVQLRELIAALPAEERSGRFLRITELVDIISQGLDSVESSLNDPA
jgi:hypothetical protein